MGRTNNRSSVISSIRESQMYPSKRKTCNSAQKYIKTGASKQEIQCASAVTRKQCNAD